MQDKAAIYAHVTSQIQIANLAESPWKNANSLKAQFETCQKYADLNGFTVVEKYEEVGSGVLPLAERPILQEVLQGVQEKRFNYIIVVSPDRIARDKEVQADIIAHLEKLGAKLVYVLDEEFANTMASLSAIPRQYQPKSTNEQEDDTPWWKDLQ